MNKTIKKISAWLLILLFVAYTSNNALFIHIHIVDDVIYVHSHPYDKGEADHHDHSMKQLTLLDFHHNTAYYPDLLATVDLTPYLLESNVVYNNIYIQKDSSHGFDNHPLRAPPALI